MLAQIRRIKIMGRCTHSHLNSIFADAHTLFTISFPVTLFFTYLFIAISRAANRLIIMDPISVVALFSSAIIVTSQVYNFARKLVEINDPKVTFIRISLATEDRRTQHWFKAMDIDSKRNQLAERIHKDDLEFIMQLLSDIDKITKRAREQFEKLDFESIKKFNAKAFLSRARWLQGEYDDIRLLLKALKALNTALYEVAEPPPRYHVSLSHKAPRSKQLVWFDPWPDDTECRQI
jgi:hypothetical protein